MVEIQGMGRGIIATAPFQKRDVVLDYHGVETVHNKGFSLDNYCAENPDKGKQEYCIEMKIGKRRITDASLETCSRHSGRSYYGRLCNQAYEKKEGKSNAKGNLRLRPVILWLGIKR